jgi:hypothetical protein
MAWHLRYETQGAASKPLREKEYPMAITKGVLAVCGAALLAGTAFAQMPPDRPVFSGPPQQPVYDPNQLPAFNGRLQQFTLSPRGEIDGFILTDGTEVKTPPHLSTQIAVTLHPGDAVTVHGLRAAAIPFIEATAVTNDTSGQSVVDYGPPRPPKGPGWWDRGPGQGTLQGRVRLTLHGPKGDVNGALLEDGTIVRLPPPEAERFASLLAPGQTVAVQGDLTATPLGRVVDATAIGSSQGELNPVDGPGARWEVPPRPPRG